MVVLVSAFYLFILLLSVIVVFSDLQLLYYLYLYGLLKIFNGSQGNHPY